MVCVCLRCDAVGVLLLEMGGYLVLETIKIGKVGVHMYKKLFYATLSNTPFSQKRYPKHGVVLVGAEHFDRQETYDSVSTLSQRSEYYR